MKTKDRGRGGNNPPSDRRLEQANPQACKFVPAPAFQRIRIEPTPQDEIRDRAEQSFKNEQLRLSRQLNGITRIGVGVTLLGAVVSVITLVLLLESLRLTRESTQAAISQAETSKSEYNASQRPWLSMQAPAANLQVGEGDAVITVTTNLSNVGHSVAKNVAFLPSLIVDEHYTGHECESAAINLRAAPRQRPQSGLIVFPGQTVTMRQPTFTEYKSDWKPLYPQSPGVHVFDLMGCVSYSSPTDFDVHFTQIMYKVLPKDQTTRFVPGTTYDVLLQPDFNGTEAK